MSMYVLLSTVCVVPEGKKFGEPVYGPGPRSERASWFRHGCVTSTYQYICVHELCI